MLLSGTSHHRFGVVVRNRSVPSLVCNSGGVGKFHEHGQSFSFSRTLRWPYQQDTGLKNNTASRDTVTRTVYSGFVRHLIVSLGGRPPALYCASNARRAAATVGPMPTIPSSIVGPSSAIQRSLRKNSRGRRTADGLPGWDAQ
jgi:hypothetical protein